LNETSTTDDATAFVAAAIPTGAVAISTALELDAPATVLHPTEDIPAMSAFPRILTAAVSVRDAYGSARKRPELASAKHSSNRSVMKVAFTTECPIRQESALVLKKPSPVTNNG